jgi:hypothetical protein
MSVSHIDHKIIASFRDFIETPKSFYDGQQYIKQLRNTSISNYTLKDSRCIWMTLLIYKFKNELEANDLIWGKSRAVILAILRQDSGMHETVQDYLSAFNEWKANDFQQFVLDIASFYYNILQIKQSIENQSCKETRDEWAPHYAGLLEKVRTSCSKLGCLTMLDAVIEQMNTHKSNIVSEVLNRAYWDKMEEEIAANNCEIIFLNMTELKTFLYEILPKNASRKEIDQFIDVDFLKQRVQKDAFDRTYLLNMFDFIMNFLTEWDALHYRQRYLQEKIKIHELDIPMPSLIRIILEKCFFYIMDLKNRKGIWNKILEENK